jgi:hypothetical protein
MDSDTPQPTTHLEELLDHLVTAHEERHKAVLGAIRRFVEGHTFLLGDDSRRKARILARLDLRTDLVTARSDFRRGVARGIAGFLTA